MHDVERMQNSLSALEAWIARHAQAGWDPFDALSSPLLQRLTAEVRPAEIAVTQLFKLLPVNLRPLLGIHPAVNPKGIALMLAAAVRRSPSVAGAWPVEHLQDWLANHRADWPRTAWGYPFAWTNRSFHVPASHPNAIATCFAGLALLDAHERLALPGSLELAREACDFVLQDLAHTGDLGEGLCFSYTPVDRRFLHNVNILCAALLVRTGHQTGESGLIQIGQAAARYTLIRQREDGAWVYGQDLRDRFIDNFHTGFVLTGLQQVGSLAGLDEALERGYRYWRATFITPTGMARYYDQATYPIDTHSVAQSILTLLAFRDRDPDALRTAWQVASWSLDHLQDREGFFYYQWSPLGANRIAYMRWSQQWMARAMAELLEVA